jgi:hypothetical protein
MGGRVPRLVDGEFLAVGQPDRRDQPPSLVGNVAGYRHALGPQFGQGGVDVIAHQVQLVAASPVGRVNGELGRGQGEDEPAVPRIHRRQPQHVAQERPDLLRLR